jgi:hypothetical protein
MFSYVANFGHIGREKKACKNEALKCSIGYIRALFGVAMILNFSVGYSDTPGRENEGADTKVFSLA